jgi:hypothetical protein
MIQTRSGRQVKKPERYEPVEKVEDDFSSDSDDSDFSCATSEFESDEYHDSSGSDGESEDDPDSDDEDFIDDESIPEVLEDPLELLLQTLEESQESESLNDAAQSQLEPCTETP